MMIKHVPNTFILSIIIFIINPAIFAGVQARPQHQDREPKSIKQSNQFYWGEAASENEKEASDQALIQLTQSISVTVSSAFHRSIQEENGKLDEAVDVILKTYSTATLKNIHTIKTEKDGRIQVFHYIEKREVDNIFQQRLELVKNIFDKAKEFEQAMNFGDALKWYFYALVLLNSVPEQIVQYNGANLLTEIPSSVNKILQSIKFTLRNDTRISDQEREIVLSISSENKIIRNLEFNFWDGQNQINVRASDGEAIVRLVGSSVQFDRLDVNVRYSYYESREEIKEVAELWNVVVKPIFKNTQVVDLKRSIIYPQRSLGTERDQYYLNLRNEDSSAVLSTIVNETNTFLNILCKQDTTAITQTYVADTFLRHRLLNLVRFCHPQIIEDSLNADVRKTSSGWELRNIKIYVWYPGLQKQAIEYLVLDFTPEGTLYDANFGFIPSMYREYIEEGKHANDWNNRQVIVKFVERYRTAFMCRDIDMLDSLFADEAVIIIGRELKKGKTKDSYEYAKLNPSQPDIAYLQLTKEQYLRRQRAIFNKEGEILLGFSTFRITRKNDQLGTYGISMRQHYVSSSYADEGYLFLLVDFNSDLPQIYVRSWQPQEWDDQSLIKLANFRVNR